MRQFYNNQNIISLTGTLMVLLFTYWSRMGMMPLLTMYNYLSIFSLAAIIFVLPDFIAYHFPGKLKWFQTGEFYTIVLILLLGALGLMAGHYTKFINYLLLPLGIGLTVWELVQFLKLNKVSNLLAGIVFMGFIILLFYSAGFHSTIYPETIILGGGHEQIFHSSISNMFLTVGWPTTGLDGVPYFNYHWGIHVLFAGLNNFLGLNLINFYNIAYTAIFLPLFFKSFFYFLQKLLVYKNIESVNVIFAITFLTLIYSLGFGNMVGIEAMPIVFENTSLSIIFSFLFGSVLLSYISNTKFGQVDNSFIIYSVITLIIISFIKISTGFVLTIGLAYLMFRNSLKIKTIIKVFFWSLLIAIPIYLFVIPEGRAARAVPIMGKIANFWASSDGFITYLLGAFILIIAVIKNNKLINWKEYKSIFHSRKYIDLEVLFILTMVGIVGGIYVSANRQDVYCFLAPQLFISIVYLTLFLQYAFKQFKASHKIKLVFLMLVLILSVISRPDILKSGVWVMHTKREFVKLTEQQQILKEYINELFKIDKEKNKKGKCIYIPHSEKWYINLKLMKYIQP